MRDVTRTHIYEEILKSNLMNYREVCFVHLKEDYIRRVYPDKNRLMEKVKYTEMIEKRVSEHEIISENGEVRMSLNLDNLKESLREEDYTEFCFKLSDGENEEWCTIRFTILERSNGEPVTAVMTIRSLEDIMN